VRVKLVHVRDHHVPEALREVRRLVDGGEILLALDCSDWTYFGSADLGALLALRKELMPLDGEIVIVSPSERLRRFIEMLGLGEAFEVFESADEARVHLERGA
jgi:anti-anti-sigma factor